MLRTRGSVSRLRARNRKFWSHLGRSPISPNLDQSKFPFYTVALPVTQPSTLYNSNLQSSEAIFRFLDHVLYSLPSITWSSNYRESTVFPFRSDFFNGGNSIEPCVRLLTISTFGIWGTSRLNGILLPILTLKLLYEMSKEQRNSVLCYH